MGEEGLGWNRAEVTPAMAIIYMRSDEEIAANEPRQTTSRRAIASVRYCEHIIMRTLTRVGR